MSVERWVAPASGAVMATIFLTLVGLYAYGVSKPEAYVTEGSVELSASPEQVMALLVDFPRRPEWRPGVARIGRIDDDPNGRAVWRELDQGDDRFDFVVVEQGPNRLVLGTASVDQVGVDTTWTFEVLPAPSGHARVRLTSRGVVDHPLYRGLFWLRSGPTASTKAELSWLGVAIDGKEPTLTGPVVLD
jgi:hypothetical protein